MIDAEFRSEERFVRLSIAYLGDEEKELVIGTAEKIVATHSIKPETHTSSIAKGREVFVIEYHDDYSREAGSIFNEIMKALNIKECI
ncbi:MAG: hypothetical protein U9P72_09745 [Campylobacterota bacterium]|nr:hypothetical protein [Campylobacterota bacterium]